MPLIRPKAANDNGRHSDLAYLVPTLSWFHDTLSLSDEPLGTGTDYGSRPPSVIDVNPKPIDAEELIRAHKANALRIAKVNRSYIQLVIDNGEEDARSYEVPIGAITHIFGAKVEQEVGRFRPSRAKAEVAARQAEMLRWAAMFGAIPPGRPKKLFKRRQWQQPIDWSRFAHIRARTLEGARDAAGLPPADHSSLKGFPYSPTPALLFAGMQAGRGPRATGDESESRTHCPDPDNYEGDSKIIDRITLQQFEAAKPDSYKTLLAATSAGSMSDLVAGNDNKTGKRLLVKALEDLEMFRAA